MSQALYRKWRPGRFDDVIGQEHITQTLQNSITADRVGHAFLFSGPRGTGKTTSARLLAKAVNCLHDDPSQRPDGTCRICTAISEGRFLDLIEIDAASNTGVDDMRALRDKINFAPNEGRFKVYIIDEVHMLSTAAFNALLKTLEEPPPHVKFILATTEEHKVPITIKSRSQIYQFRLLTIPEIKQRLNWLAEKEGLTIEPEALALIARQGAGSLRDAESLLDQLVTAPNDTITLERTQKVLGTTSDESLINLTQAWLANDGGAGLQIIHNALSTGVDVRQFGRQMVVFLRGLLLLQASQGKITLEMPASQQEEMSALAEQAPKTALLKAIRKFTEAATTTSASWQPQLPLELAFIESLQTVEVEKMPAGKQSSSQPTPVTSKPAASRQPPTTNKPTTAATIPLDQVTTSWPALMSQIRQKERNLSALLASAKPLKTQGNIIILGFDFPILKDKFDKNSKANQLVADTLGNILQTSCLVQTTLSKNITPSPPTPTVSTEEFHAFASEHGGIVEE